jgi:hypothetical protein
MMSVLEQMLIKTTVAWAVAVLTLQIGILGIGLSIIWILNNDKRKGRD